MTFGLAGTGSESGWHVDIDEILGRDCYGITITNRQYWLQVAGLPLDRIMLLHKFLTASERQERLHLLDAFGGNLDLVRDEGRLAVRVTQLTDESWTNLVEIMLQPPESAALAIALERAIQDVKEP